MTAAEKKAAEKAEAEKKAELEKAAAEKAEAESAEPLVEKKVKILIPSSSDFDGKEDVFLNCNGRRFQIQRDIEVEVPQIVVNVLKDAVKDEQITDNAGRITGVRKVQRYPFQTL